jgi:uncharacterized membrane protein YeaQ/YmgE (transglycosylase-associated protein family)
MGIIGAIISWIIIGGIIGLIARAIMPGEQPRGFVSTVLLGGLFGGGGPSSLLDNPWSFATIALSVVGALIVMVIYGLATRRHP